MLRSNLTRLPCAAGMLVFLLCASLPAAYAESNQCKSITYCQGGQADPDGDGWGFENKASCVIRGSQPDPNRGLSCSAASQAPQSDLNPNFFYFFNGEIPGSRGFTLGDPKNWSVPVVGLRGTSASGKLTVQPEDYQGEGYALNALWSRSKNLGQLALYGPPLDISAAKDLAALVVDVKVVRKPNSNVTISLDCQWPCRGSVEAAQTLKKMPVNKWAALPIPLNCFRGENFDLSKINGVFLLSTEGRMELSIANIRLERLEPGNTGCAG